MTHRSGSEVRVRTVVLPTRWSPTEYDLLQEIAEHSDVSAAEVLRRLVRQSHPQLIPSRSLVHDVRRIGQNINQIARHANTARSVELLDALQSAYADLLDAIRRMLAS
ncbi:plasmid mobilization relaxosome protein MobC [Sphingobium sp. SJ10-10]|uniref:plasmid mobilization protein n=1 Tax=Sphingobium sp. SJ10-10 TaxID=3114999 RepID=UPI002EC2CE8C|nr:plasmid mobilization relaxosome protein MobC [Sphingobium sp. SJ10-10]